MLSVFLSLSRETVFTIGQVTVEEDVARASFCCDTTRCLGVCCTLEGARGAPLRDDELQELIAAFPAAKSYLSPRALATIEKEGLFEGLAGDYATRCVDGRECVFAYFEHTMARCSFERAFNEGKTSWRKPISCHLFPIRVSKNGRDLLRYLQIPECQAGREQGRHEEMPLREFLRDPLVRVYGEVWYQKFTEVCASSRQ